MTRDVVERVREVAARVAADHGLDIFDVQFRREAGGMVLRVQIDRPGPASTAEDSVSVEDCAAISRDLSAVLDVEDIVPTANTLDVIRKVGLQDKDRRRLMQALAPCSAPIPGAWSTTRRPG